ncbi:Benzoate 4-monooxygenase 1 [Colletotrichum truncatum]|uniref:Benzoate 4-monooxygenase 1 n=1 Tax=Colletotrichum truncatum TaxID=5467 RepID=A0ACC3YET1_COLTU|nr:Benzoate 4-monooxygenase 1 [Colletotrichum truncatum]KAF6783226.1 Benzoate 4-monooxygenase 1 [Colletotrichum truncatum]
MHDQYDTRALRIGPNELHLTDVSLYKTIYNQTTPYLKHKPFYDSFSTPHTIFAECQPQLHKQRRKILNPFFSRTGVLKLEPIITEKIELFLAKVKKIGPNGPIEVGHAFRCLTVDVISQFAFGRSRGLIHEVEVPDRFESDLLKAIDDGGDSLAEIQHNPLLRYLTSVVPLSFISKFNDTTRQIHNLQQFARDSVSDYNRFYKSGAVEAPHPIIFDSLKDVSHEEQAMEAVDILLAGCDTTAFTVETSLFYILQDKRIKEKLVAALRTAIPNRGDMPPLLELEKIEYLWACVKESLRVAMPVAGQLPRVVPKGAAPLVVDGKVIPPGTIIGMSAYTMHTSPELWGPDARSFNPDRWLGPAGKTLDQHLYTFGKGVRQCIGINVAHAEATMLLAYLFTNFEMTLKTRELETWDSFVCNHKKGVFVDFKYIPV